MSEDHTCGNCKYNRIRDMISYHYLCYQCKNFEKWEEDEE